MNRFTAHFRTPELSIGRFDHPQNDSHQDPEEENCLEHSINLVERGSFSVCLGRNCWQLGPGDLFLTRPGMVYRCHHHEDVPTDSCLTVSYAALRRREGADLARIAAERVVLKATSRAAYLFRSFSKVLDNQGQHLAVESSAAALLSEISGGVNFRRKTYNQRQLAWYAERVDGVRDLLQTHYSAEHTLSSMARSVGMSTFHFARIFGELTGLPPHRYLLRLRMHESARRLSEGASVTEACFNTGFRNLSHFVRTFQRWFGVSPSRYRKQRVA